MQRVSSRLEEMGPKEFAWASGMLYNQWDFDPKRRKEKKAVHWKLVPRTLSCFSTFGTLLTRTIWVIKGQEKSWLCFYISVLFSFSTIQVFSLTANDSLGKFYLAVSLVDMHPVTVLIWMVTKFSYSLLGVYLSDVSWRQSNLFLTLRLNWLMISQMISEVQSFREALSICFLFLRWLKRIFDGTIP